MLKKSIPHVFTSLNLISGCVATYFAFSHQFNAALFFVLFGVFFDFFDGFFARLLKVESALGIQLDSMADLITSGIAPGVLMYQMFLLSGVKQLDYTINLIPNFSMTFALAPVALFGFGITLGAAFRLARFNLIGENLPYFKGLPAPANAIMIMGLPLIFRHPNLIQFNEILMNPLSLMCWCLVSIFLMNVHWKMFSLKFSGGMSALFFPVLLLIGSTILLLQFGITVISGIIVLYILLSAIKYIFKI